MKKLILLCLLTISLGGFVPVKSAPAVVRGDDEIDRIVWMEVSPAQAGFQISFPGRPEYKVQEKSQGRTTQQCTLVFGSGKDAVQLRVDSNEYGGGLNPKTAKETLMDSDQFFQTLEKALGAKMTESKIFSLGIHQARSARFSGENVSARVLVAISETNYFAVQAVTANPQILDSKVVTHFFDSFKIVPGGPGGVRDGGR